MAGALAALVAAADEAVAEGQAGTAALPVNRHLRIRRPAPDVRAASVVALQSGGRVVPHPLYGVEGTQVVEWSISGNCQAPLVVEQIGEGCFRGSEEDGFRHWKGEVWEPMRVLMLRVRCRQCEGCLRARRAHWMRLAVNEYHRASRVWFGTLTFRPELRYRLMLQTRQRLAWGGLPPEPGKRPMVVLDHLSDRQQFGELHREAGPLVTNYLKALRKGRARKGYPATRFRYLLVVEPHRDWFPHYHLLAYEVSELMPLRKESLDDLWPYGFTKWRLARDPRACIYAAKYLGKFAMARVRASLNFGQPGESASQGFEERITF